jgi:hypothetical protein
LPLPSIWLPISCKPCRKKKTEEALFDNIQMAVPELAALHIVLYRDDLRLAVSPRVKGSLAKFMLPYLMIELPVGNGGEQKRRRCLGCSSGHHRMAA